MQLPTKAVLGLGLLVGQAAAAPHDISHVHRRQTTASTSCSTGVHVIVGAPASYPAQLGLLSTLVSSIQTNITGSDYVIVPYDQSATPAIDATPVMQQYIAQYATSCPNTPIVLIGYSRGGIVVMNTLCQGLSPTYLHKNVIAATSYGEETYVAGQSYDVGTCTNNAPSYARNSTNLAGCATYAPIIKSWCNSADPACCSGGTDSNAHFTYASLYDPSAVSWIWQEYQAYLAAKTKPTSSSSRSVSKPTSTKKSTSKPKTTHKPTHKTSSPPKPTTTPAPPKPTTTSAPPKPTTTPAPPPPKPTGPTPPGPGGPGNPPAGNPPAGNPPAGNPPAGNPPSNPPSNPPHPGPMPQYEGSWSAWWAALQQWWQQYNAWKAANQQQSSSGWDWWNWHH